MPPRITTATISNPMTRSGQREPGDDDSDIGDHVILREDPARPHVNLSFPVFGKDYEAGDVGCQGDQTDAEHEPGVRFAAEHEAADYIGEDTARQSDLEPATLKRGGGLDRCRSPTASRAMP